MGLSPRWRKVSRDLVIHWFRTLLVVISIAVGIFAIAVVMGGRGILLREFDSSYALSAAPTVTFYTGPFDEHLTRRVAAMSEVRAAEGRRQVGVRYMRGRDPGGTTAGWNSLRIVAIRDFAHQSVQRIVPEDVASWPPRPGEIVLERSVKQVESFKIGDMVTVETGGGTRLELRVAGFAHDINTVPAKFTGTITGFIDFASLGDFDEPAEFNQIAIVLADPEVTRVEASAIAEDIRDDILMAQGVEVYGTDVPEPGSHFLGDIFKAVSLLLLALGVLSLALSGFLVVNTVSALMSQQVAQVGVMKAVGGRSAQVMRMYMAMVFVYGIGGVAVGVPAGLAAGRWFTAYAAGLLNFRITSYVPPTYVIVLEIVVGVLVPLLAAIVPVWLGTRISVVRALNATGLSAAKFGHGLVDRALGLLRGLPRPVALSLRNTFLRKGRLALTLTTLTLASAVVMAVLSVRATMLQTVTDIDQWWNYDVQVRLAHAENGDELEREAADVDGVRATETWVERGAILERSDGTQNETLWMIGLPPQTGFIKPHLVTGRWLEPDDTDAIVVNTDIYKDEPDVRVGRRVTLEVQGEKRDWRVVGVVSGQLMGPVIFAAGDEFGSLVGAGGEVNRLLVKTDHHDAYAQEHVALGVETRFDTLDYAVSRVETRSQMRDRVAGQLGILVVFLVIMASLLAVVGVIGLTGTMSINVLESTREIGVMRALGATHRAIYQIFMTEGIVVGVIAWGLGALAAYPISYGLTRLLEDAMGIPLSFTFSYSGVGIWLASVVVIAAAASIAPAFRASQVSVRDAIAYE